MRLRSFARIWSFAFFGIALAVPTVSPALERDTQDDAADSGVSSSVPGVYERVLIDPLKVLYTTRFRQKKNLRGERIEGADLERIRRYYREVVSSKLAAYPVASGPGPGVMRVDAVLIDPVLRKSDWLQPSRLVFRGVPHVELIALLRDSQTGEVVDRVGITLRRSPNRLMKESPGNHWYFMRLVFDRIATRIRWTLEDIAEAASS